LPGFQTINLRLNAPAAEQLFASASPTQAARTDSFHPSCIQELWRYIAARSLRCTVSSKLQVHTLMQPIKFVTDGWRGIIAEDYTFENVRRAASAIANYVLKNEDSSRGVAIGYDTRFGSRMFAQLVAEVMATAGINARLASDYTPTPALSFAVKYFGAAG